MKPMISYLQNLCILKFSFRGVGFVGGISAPLPYPPPWVRHVYRTEMCIETADGSHETSQPLR